MMHGACSLLPSMNCGDGVIFLVCGQLPFFFEGVKVLRSDYPLSVDKKFKVSLMVFNL